jgi:hypothetical protein
MMREAAVSIVNTGPLPAQRCRSNGESTFGARGG